MIFNEYYQEYIKSEKDLKEHCECETLNIKNNFIKQIQIAVIAHFGNAVSLNVQIGENRFLPVYNMTGSIGYIMQILVDFFDKNNEDGMDFCSEMKNIPIRVVEDESGTIVAIGHFMEDRFLIIDELFGRKGGTE